MRSKKSQDFYIDYNKTQDYSKNDSYLIKGHVTNEDWEELNLESDFMAI
jgi:hypothetical protein